MNESVRKEDITCRKAYVSDAADIARLHCQALPNDPATLLGEDFLAKRLYPFLLKDSEASLVAVDEENKPIGFAVFSSAKGVRLPGLLRQLAQRIVSGVVSIRQALVAVGSVGYFLLRSRGKLPNGVELVWIAVDSNWQGRGVGTLLLESGLRTLRCMGHSSVWVKTLYSTPQNTQFYRKAGFRVTSNYAGRVILRHLKSTESASG